MCLLIVKKTGKSVPEYNLKNGFYNNRNGCGFAFIHNQELVIRKGMWTWEEFLAKYKEVENVDSPMLIHFRHATEGEKTELNCHPFNVLNKWAFGHNGSINIKVEGDYSDTRTFVERVFEEAIKDGVDPTSNWFHYLMEGRLGTLNKVAILSKEGKFHIYNEKEGEWENGVWFSSKWAWRYADSNWLGRSKVKIYPEPKNKTQKLLTLKPEKKNSEEDSQKTSEAFGTKKETASEIIEYALRADGYTGTNLQNKIKELSGIPDFEGKEKKKFCDKLEEEIEYLCKAMSLPREDAIVVLEGEWGHSIEEEEDFMFHRRTRPTNYEVGSEL